MAILTETPLLRFSGFFFLKENEKEKLSILTVKRKMTCACEFLKVYLFRMMTISDIQSKTGNLQVQLGLLCNFDHVVVNYVDVNVNVKLPA